MQTVASPATLSQKTRNQIDEWLKKYPPEQRQAGVIAALTMVQDENGGYLTVELMDAVAAYLGMPKIAVYEVATFYSMFELKPVGKHKICVCTNISCMLKGSDDIVEYLQAKLGIKLGETTQDGKFTLKYVECLAACGGAPMMQIGREYHENLTPEKIDKILASLE
ncbi:NADH-quinone oxidoreductase subunit NuoE [Candidatus Berkiella aquae]|nr:NADH-quinone oxidoreductase subunit NuoE [Candidatus Berkiella aquae]